MKNLNTTCRISVLSRIILAFFVVAVVSCEELTDNLSPRDNIIDTWKCQETDASNSVDNFLVEIVEDDLSLTGVKIYNFNHLGESFVVKASVSGTSVTILNQTVGGFTISGSGTLTADYEKITLKYSVDDGGGKENYNAVLTKP
jgi:hypothetical protein